MADIATLIVAISARGAVAGSKKYVGAIHSMGSANKLAAGSMGGLKSAAIKLFAVLGGAVALKQSTSLMMTFQDVMAQIEGVTNATADEMIRFNAVARELGATTRFTATEAGEGLLNLSRAGFAVEESTSAIAATLDLATAAIIDLGQASSITATTIKQFGLNADEARRVADVLVNSANSANTVVPDLAQALSFAGVAAKSAGISFEETAAAIAILQDQGIQGSRAGAGLRQAILRLINPTTEARQAIKEMGLSMKEVDPTKLGIVGAFNALRDVELDLGKAAKIFGTRQATAGLILANNADAVDKLTESNEKNMGVARRLAALLEATLGGALKELISTVQEVILQIGEAGFAGAVQSAIKFVTALIRELAGINQKASAVTPAVAGMAEALRKGWSAMKLIIALALPLVIGLLAVKLWAATAAMIAFGVAVVQANIGLLAFAAGIVGMVIPALVTMAKTMLSVLLPAIAVFAAAYLGFKFGQWISQFAPVQRFMQKAIEGFAKGWQWLKKTSRTIWAVMKSLFITLFIQPIQTAFNFMVDSIFKGVNWVAKKAKDAIQGIPGTAEAYKSLARVIEATTGGFKSELVRDTIVEDAKIIEQEYQKALKSIEDNTAAVFAKIAKGADVPKKSFKEMVQEDMQAAIEAMNMFGANSDEANQKLQDMQDHVARLRREMAENNQASEKMVSLWDRAKGKVIEFGTAAVNWFKKLGDEQTKADENSKKFKITLEDIGGAAASTLTDLAMGATTFKDAISDITEQLIRMAIQMAIMSAFTTPGGGTTPVAPAGAKGLVAMAAGGIVSGPTPALIGERGPEAVIPLERDEKGILGLAGGGTTVNETTFQLVSPDSRGIKDMLLRDPKLIKQMNETYAQGYAID